MNLLKLVILAGSEQGSANKIKDFLPEEYSFFEITINHDGLQILRNTAAGIVLVDMASSEAAAWVKEANNLRPELSYIGVVEEEIKYNEFSFFYDWIWPPFSTLKLHNLLERAWERSQLIFELSNLKEKSNREEAFVPAGNNQSLPGLKERVLCDFSRSLGSNFNRDKLLELFMDAVTELVPVGKISILLLQRETGTFKICAQRGLDPSFCNQLSFNSTRGIVPWLEKEGRILLCSEGSPFAGEALQEMEFLQASASIPLSAQGQMIGVLNLGPKVTGSLFYEEELEVLYFLCGNLAMALRDIELHHQVRHQNSYIESILQRMTSGVIAININDKITTFNTRAEEILSFTQEEVLGKDLRLLPSPLGDYLYNTLSTGECFDKEEIVLPNGQIPLEISTYRLSNGKDELIGSVMIFDDISDRKQLEAERRKSDKIEVLNKFVGELAHEIKNPMVAIQTFAELLQDKYEDSSFRDFFTHTVRQELKRLNELVEKLIAFSAPLTYNFTEVDVHEIIDTGFSLLQDQGKFEDINIETRYNNGPLKIKADKTILARAFSYLLNELVQTLGAEGSIYVETLCDNSIYNEGVQIHLKDANTVLSSQSSQKRKDVSIFFDPLSINENEYISLGMPVSRKIIEDHGGSIKAYLTGEKHFQFEILLPVLNL